MTYINGIKASKKDIFRLWQAVKDGGKITIRRTAKGNTAITTLF